jgi:hypothetical protein
VKHSFAFRYSLDEFQAATWFSVRKQWIWKGAVRYVLILTAIIAAIILFPFDDFSFLLLIGSLFVGLLVGCLVMAFLVLYWFWCVPRSVRKIYHQMQLAGGEVTIEFDENQIEISDPTTTSRIPWNHVVKWAENKRFLLIYRNDIHCHYIPKQLIEPYNISAIKAELIKSKVIEF